VQLVAAPPLGHAEFARAHIGNRQAPAGGPAALALQHHGAEPVVAAGGEHALLQHGAGGEHAGDVALEQGALGRAPGRGLLQLVAQGHAQAAAHQLGAVALGGVVGDARHRYPTERLAGLLAGEGELQQAGEADGVLEEALEEVAQAVEQHPLGMGALEFHVVAQHRRELLGLHQAVVMPARQVAGLADLAFGWSGGRFRGGSGAFTGGGAAAGIGGARVPPGASAAAARPGPGIGFQIVGVKVARLRLGVRPARFPGEPCGLDSRSGTSGAVRRCRLPERPAEQIALQAQLRHERELLLGFRGHGRSGAGGTDRRGAGPPFPGPRPGARSRPRPAPPTTCEGTPGRPRGEPIRRVRIPKLTGWRRRRSPCHRSMQILNTLTVLALVVLSFALIVAVPVLYASSEDAGRSNRLILLGGLAWVALVLLNWGVSFFVV